MAYLPLSNILHYKLRSALSALGIGIGICMLITLSGLAHGTLGEISDRWEAVDADLIVYPREWGDNVVTVYGIGLSDRYADKIRKERADLVQNVIPVFLTQMKIGGQDQTVVGVDSFNWPSLAGGRQLLAGELFDAGGQFTDWMVQSLRQGGGDDEPAAEDFTERFKAEMARRGGMEMVIDSRLAGKAKLAVGDSLTAGNVQWKIVGIAPSGVMARAFIPRRAAQYLFGLGGIDKSTLLFVKLKPGVSVDQAAASIRNLGYLEAIPVRQYRGLLESKFGAMFRYIDAVNLIAMIISFLFIMVTLYMMVLQRTREIAILKSFGASSIFILRQIVAESLILTCTGAAAGIGMSFLAAWAIGKFLPLYTVTITWPWLVVAGVTALAGAMVSALYPAWRATRVDMVEALTLE